MKVTRTFAYIVSVIAVLFPCVFFAWVAGSVTGLWEYMFLGTFIVLVLFIIHVYFIDGMTKRILISLAKEFKAIEENGDKKTKEMLLTATEENNQEKQH